jgi:hypothetical protein
VIAPDLVAAVAPVLAVLRDLHVRHYVGGSIASSAHGGIANERDDPRSRLPRGGASELSVADLLVRALANAEG